MEIKLTETASYLLSHLYEDVYFTNKTTDERLFIGDHYGDPEFGLISEVEGWCISAGEGILFRDADARMWSAFRQRNRDSNIDAQLILFENKQDELWTLNARSNHHFPGFISALNVSETGEIEIELDPLSHIASKWKFNIANMTIKRI